MWAYVDEVQKLVRCFDGLKLEHVPQGPNIIADELSQIAAKQLLVHTGIFIERLTKQSETLRTVVRTLATSLEGAVSATTTHQDSATPARGDDPEPDPIAALAERATPQWAEELVQYLKF
jgi:hypothetical protein